MAGAWSLHHLPTPISSEKDRALKPGLRPQMLESRPALLFPASRGRSWSSLIHSFNQGQSGSNSFQKNSSGAY